MKNIFLAILVFLCSAAFAGVRTKSAAIGDAGQPASLVNGAILEVQDYEYFNNSSYSFVVKSIKNRVRFDFLMNQCQTGAFTASVNVEVKVFASGSSTAFKTDNKVLTINYDPSNPYTSSSIVELICAKVEFETNGRTKQKVQVKITGINKPGNVNLNNFKLSVENEKESYVTGFSATMTGIVGTGPTQPTSPNELKVSWDNKEWAEAYDLEWLYVNNYDSDGNGDLAASSIVISEREFQFNSTRVHITANSYSIPLVYDKGYILYRVRGYGRTSSDNYQSDIPMEWSSFPPFTNVGAFADKYKIEGSSIHNRELNWQTNIMFAEEGKNKTVAQYFDGSLRNRQEVTKFSTPYSGIKKATVVGETIYDFEGRPAVTVLPVPSKSEVIAFHPSFNLSQNNSGKVYSKKDFDSDPVPCGLDAQPMSTTSGASAYYSSSNEFLADMGRAQKFVPDAQKYPFVQKKYTRDNTGRVLGMSAPGYEFQFKSIDDHTTRYIYGRPDQIELDRLFGSDVGYATHYKKTVVVDANGQSSISYTDMQGKTIATSLIGATPYSVNALQSPAKNAFMNVDLLNKVRSTDSTGKDNILNLDAKTKTVNYDLIVSDAERRNFYYELGYRRFTPGCIADGSPAIPNPTAILAASFSNYSYTVPAPSPTSNAMAMAVGDLDNDGYQDVVSVTGNASGNKVAILRNNTSNGVIGTESFTKIDINEMGTRIVLKVEISDLNLDNKKDIIMLVNDGGTYKVCVLKNNGNLEFSLQEVISSGVGATVLAVGDINADGLLDIITSTSAANNLNVHVNTITLTGAATPYTFAVPIALTTSNPILVRIADMNQDKINDLIVANSSKQVSVYLSTVDASTATSGARAAFGTGTTLPTFTGDVKGFDVADMNGDSKLDIVVANYSVSTSYITIYHNTTTALASTSTFAVSSNSLTYSANYGPILVRAADINKDGFMDMIVANSSSPYLYAFQGTASVFNAPVNMLSVSGYNYKGIELVDVDHNGRMDILMLDAAGKMYFHPNNISGIPTCYECVLDLEISLKATDNCQIEYLSGVYKNTTPVNPNIAFVSATKMTLGPLEAITNNPDFLPLYNCAANPAIFTRGNKSAETAGGPNIWETSILNGETSTPSMLPKGAYKLSKVLKVNQKALDIYTHNYITENNCLKSIEDFRKEELALIDFSQCGITCEERLVQMGCVYEQNSTSGKWEMNCRYEASAYYNSNEPPTPPSCTSCLTATEYEALKVKVLEECGNRDSVSCKNELSMLRSDMSPGGQYGKLYDINTNDKGAISGAGDQIGAMDPGKFPLSVFNTNNVLPQKSAMHAQYQAYYLTNFPSDQVYGQVWAPNWSYPYNRPASGVAPTEKNFSYLDEKGDIVYVEIQKSAAEGEGYIPAVKPYCYDFIIENNGKLFIKPQYLNNVVDFLKFWQAQWAASLVIYHPEYGYYEQCIARGESNEWDSYWLMTKNALDVSTTNYNGALVTIKGANAIYPNWAPAYISPTTLSDAANNLIGYMNGSTWHPGLDPYFSTVTMLPNERESMKDRMIHFAEETTSGGTRVSISIWELAYRMVHCPTNLNLTTVSSSNCNSCAYNQLGLEYNGYGANPYANQEWDVFKMLYQSLKQQILKAHETRVAIKNGYYNGCIDNKPFNAFRDNFILYYYIKPGAYPAWLKVINNPLFKYYNKNAWPKFMTNQGIGALFTSQFLNPEQPCNSSRFNNYKGKQARFPQTKQMNHIQSIDDDSYPNPVGMDELSLPYNMEEAQAIVNELKDIEINKGISDCKTCPLARQFEGFINKMIEKNDLEADKTITLYECANSNTPALYEGISDELLQAAIPNLSNYSSILITYTSTQALTTPGVLKYTGTFKLNGNAVCSLTLDIPYTGASLSLKDITRFCCFINKTTEESIPSNGFSFVVTATIKLKPTDPEYASIANVPGQIDQTKQVAVQGVSGCLDLVNCGLSNRQCFNTEVGVNLQNLFNGLLYKRPYVDDPTGLAMPLIPGFLPNGNLLATHNAAGAALPLPLGSPPDACAQNFKCSTAVANDFICLNDKEDGKTWTGLFTKDILKRLSIGSYSDDYKVYWASKYEDCEKREIRAYFYNREFQLDNNGVMTTTRLSFDSLAFLNACSINFKLGDNYAWTDAYSCKHYPYRWDDVIGFVTMKGDGNTFTMKAKVRNTRGVTNSKYEYLDVTGGSTCFVFGQCGVGIVPSDFVTAETASESENEGFGPAVIEDFIVETTNGSNICPSPSDPFEVKFARINNIMRNWIDRVENGKHFNAFPQNTYYYYGGQYADPIGQPQFCSTDCRFLLLPSSPVIDFSEIVQIVGISRAYGSQTAFKLYVKIKGDNQTYIIPGLIGHGNNANVNFEYGSVFNGIPGFSTTFVTNLNCGFDIRKATDISHSSSENPTPLCTTCGNLLYTSNSTTDYSFERNYNPIGYLEELDAYGNKQVSSLDNRLYNGSVFRTALTGNYKLRGLLLNEGAAYLNMPPSQQNYYLADNEYAVLLWNNGGVGCNPFHEMVFRLPSPYRPGQTAPSYKKIWETSSTNPIAVASNKNYKFSFTMRRADISSATAAFFRVKVTINGVPVAYQKFNYGAFTYRYDMQWQSGSAVSANIKIELENTDPCNISEPSLDPTTQSHLYALSSLMFETDCKPVNCCPEPELRITVVDRCKESLRTIAEKNARVRYRDYIDDISLKFQNQYVAECLKVYEEFYMRYNSSEDHFTLYYYDQAGNLTRTVPPQGVKVLNTITDAAKLEQIKIDRDLGVKTVLTEHTMATTYKYNSLNQLQNQSTPDNEDMRIFKAKQVSGNIPAGQTINDISFSSVSEGVAVTDDLANGFIYKTTNAGSTWDEVKTFGVPDFNDIKKVTYIKANFAQPLLGEIRVNREFIVGNNGTYIEDGNLKPVPTNKNIIKVETTTINNKLPELLMVPNIRYWKFKLDGTAFYTDNYGTDWVGPVTNYVVEQQGNPIVNWGEDKCWQFHQDGVSATMSNSQMNSNLGQYYDIQVTIKDKPGDKGTGTCRVWAFESDGTAWYRDVDELNPTWKGPITSLEAKMDGDLKDISFRPLVNAGDENHAYAISETGVVYVTNDGCVSWKRDADEKLCLMNNYALSSMHFWGGNAGFIGGDNGLLLKGELATNTVSNPVSWSVVPNNLTTAITKMHYTNATTGVVLAKDAAGTSLNMHYTSDGGQTFTQVKTDIADFYFVNSTLGYTVSTSGLVFKTTNGGKTWTQLAFSPSMGTNQAKSISAYAYSFPLGGFTFDQTFILVGGENAKLYLSKDIGATAWTLMPVSFSGVSTQSVSQLRLYASTNNMIVTTMKISMLLSDGKLLYTSMDPSNISAITWSNTLPSGANGPVVNLTFYDAENGYAYNNTGKLLYTNNVGATWSVAPIAENAFLGKAYFIDKSKGIVINGQGKISVTENADNTTSPVWSDQSNLLRTPRLKSIHVTTDYVHAAGENGVWVYSKWSAAPADPEYQKWYILKTGISSDFNDIISSNGDIYAVGTNGLITKPNLTDPAAAYSFPKMNLMAPFVNNYTGIAIDAITNPANPDLYVIGENKVIVKGTFNTANPASPALTMNVVAGGNVPIKAIAILNAASADRFGVIGGKGNLLAKDATINWTPKNRLNASPLKSVYMVTPEIGYIVGQSGNIWKTTTGGDSWIKQTGIPSGATGITFNAVHFKDINTGIAVGNGGWILFTNNGGTTWTQQTSGVSVNLNSVFWTSPSMAVIAGNSGTVLKNTNAAAGSTWSAISVGSPFTSTNFSAVSSPEPALCYIVGNSGKMLKIENLTTTPALTSLPCTTPTCTASIGYAVPIVNLSDVYFKDRVVGYVIGDSRAFYKTIDGGNVWTQMNPNTELGNEANNFKTLAVRDAHNFVLGGNNSVSPTRPITTNIYDFTNEFSTRFYYDALGRMVASQNSKQYNATETHNRYSYTNYDAKGRIVEVGEIDATTPIEVVYNKNVMTDEPSLITGKPITSRVVANLGNGNWNMGSWTRDQDVTTVVSNGNLLITEKGTYTGANYTFPTVPGRVYRVRFKIESGTMKNISATMWYSPYINGNNWISVPMLQSQNGLDRELTYTATQTLTNFTILKDWVSAGEIGLATTVELKYLIIEELSSSAIQYITKKEMFYIKQWMDVYGSITQSQYADPTVLRNKIGSRFLFASGADLVKGFAEASLTAEGSTIKAVWRDGFSMNDGMDPLLYNEWMEANKTSKHQITHTYYDDAVLDANLPLDFEAQNLRGRVSSTTFTEKYNADKLVYDNAIHYSYDIHGNVKEMLVENPKLANAWDLATSKDFTFKRILYDYDLISGKVNAVHYQPNESDEFHHRYTYDADNKITEVETSTDGVVWESDGRYQYYLHGPLARTELGEDNVQGLDYAYTMQGWLKAVNSSTLASATNDIGEDGKSGGVNQWFAKDEMGYNLGYFSNDYTAIGAAGITASTNPITVTAGTDLLPANHSRDLYNGNISHMITAIGRFTSSGSTAPMGTSYNYDQLNRIAEAKYYNNIDNATNTWKNNNAPLSDYLNTFTYDANGNILKQKRNGSANVSLDMDDLTYNYYSGTNKLKNVTDAKGSALYIDDIDNQVSNNYVYDESGNLIKDLAEEIDKIEWNVYGKIKNIIRISTSSKPDLYFEYGPDGNRVVKTIVPKGYNKFPVSTYYVRDAQGNILATYERTFTKTVDFDTLSYKQVNDSIIKLSGASTVAFGSFISSQNMGGIADTLLLVAQTADTATQSQIIQGFGQTLMTPSFSELRRYYDPLVIQSKFTEFLFNQDGGPSVEQLGNNLCSTPEANGFDIQDYQNADISLLRSIMMNNESRTHFMKMLMDVNYSLYNDVQNYMTGPGTTGVFMNDVYKGNGFDIDGTHWIPDPNYIDHITYYTFDRISAYYGWSCSNFGPFFANWMGSYSDPYSVQKSALIFKNLSKGYPVALAKSICNCSSSVSSGLPYSTLIEYLDNLSPEASGALITALFALKPAIADEVMTNYGYPDNIKYWTNPYFQYNGSNTFFNSTPEDNYNNTVNSLSRGAIYSYLSSNHPDLLDCSTSDGNQLLQTILLMAGEEVFHSWLDGYIGVSDASPQLRAACAEDHMEYMHTLSGYSDDSYSSLVYDMDPVLYYYTMLKLWDRQTLLSHIRYTDQATFTAALASRYPNVVSAYQQNHNLYSGSGNGMEAYFTKVKESAYFGSTFYNNLLQKFYNVSSTYVDTLKLKELTMYGSSRLGVRVFEKPITSSKFSALYSGLTFVSVVEKSNSTVAATNSGIYLATRGYKQFELSNHLGNVLTVVTDKKMPACAPLVKMTEPFNSGTGSWTSYGGQSTFVSNGNQKLNMKGNGSVTSYQIKSPAFSIVAGRTYQFSFDLSMISGSQIYITTSNGGGGVTTQLFNNNARNVYTFTAGSAGSTQIWLNYFRTTFSSAVDYSIDNVELLELNTGGLQSFSADVVAANDYSPFGAPLAGRSYSRAKETSRKIHTNNTFASGTESWLQYNTIVLSNDNGRLKCLANAVWGTARKNLTNLVVNKTYRITFKLDMGNCTVLGLPLYNSNFTNYVTFNNYGVTGLTESNIYSVTFRATESTMNLMFEVNPGNGTISAGNPRYFWLDDFVVEEDVTYSDYRFGFNGMEKENEVSGDGNSYTTTHREYDPRLGRWFSCDPEEKDYEDVSPYCAMDNDPIRNNDPEGDDWWDRVMGAVVGTATNVIPASTGLRNTYTPNDPDDYNNTLENTDKVAMALGGASAVGGAGAMAVGGGMAAAGGAVSLTGVGVVAGAPTAALGGVIAAEGAVAAATGAVLMTNATNNQKAGYNYGKPKQQASNSSATGQSAQKPKDTKHTDNRHVDRTKYPDKSKYSKPSQKAKLQERTMKKPDVKKQQSDGRIVYEKDFKRKIGTKGETSHKVVVDQKKNKIVTSYPQKK